MPMPPDDYRALETLEQRLRALLPEIYRRSFDGIEPVSMGSAGLKYDDAGNVAWDRIWGSFCDLAMAGGPPHKGLLLEPASEADIQAQPDRYQTVVEEICRGVTLVTSQPATRSPMPGWVRVTCESDGMASWLLRAIVMENVSARAEGTALDLPAGPHYRLQKEIKNVVTVIAKTCHYWVGHIWRPRQFEIADLFEEMSDEAPLVGPPGSDNGAAAARADADAAQMAGRIHHETGLAPSSHRYVGWLGLTCPSARSAIWMMRMLVASNILSRREDTVLFVPVNPLIDPGGDRVIAAVRRVHRFAIARGYLSA